MATTQGAPVVKNLLIKDASGNTQMIEVVQTAPGKFVTAGGKTITTAASAAPQGVKTIIRTPQGHHQIITTGTSPQLVRTITTTQGTATMIKQQGGRQVMAIPIQGQGGIPLLKSGTQFIQPKPGNMVVSGQPLMQVIQAGNQRLLVATPNGPQFVQAGGQGQPITTFVTGTSSSPGGAQTLAGLTSALGLKQNFISPILDHTGARKRVDYSSDISYEAKRRKSEKGGKGLRHFSMKVCEKVRTKGITTYNEVADELVQEFATPGTLSAIEQQFDQKNIRRRVYDALNVLMAMNIISKEKKEIKWLGLPTNSMQECTTLEKDRAKRIERLKQKTQQLHDLIIQQVAFKSLVERNKQKEKESGPPPPHGSIHLPFLIVNTAKNTVIDCSISNDKMEYLFNFDGTFEIHDDIEVLKRMGLALGLDKGECTDEDTEKAKSVLPKALGVYVDQIAKRVEDWRGEFADLEYDDGYYQDGDDDDMDGDGMGYEVSGTSNIAFSTPGDLSGMAMSVEDLEMQAAIQSLHPDDSAQDMGNDMDEESYGDEGEEDEEGLSD